MAYRKHTVYYVNRKDRSHRGVETVAETTERNEALFMAREYNLADLYGDYYVSTQRIRDWRDKT